jgi:hypothetical protein
VDYVAWAKNRTKSKVRAKVEDVFQVMKLKFGFVKVRYRGLEKNAQVVCHLRAGQPICQSQETAAGGRIGASSSPNLVRRVVRNRFQSSRLVP